MCLDRERKGRKVEREKRERERDLTVALLQAGGERKKESIKSEIVVVGLCNFVKIVWVFSQVRFELS